MRLYIVRHGQSEDNLHHVHTGWRQSPLAEAGLSDARRAGEFLQKVPADKIFTSDLKRAMQTCETALPGAEYECLPLIREIDNGTLTGQHISVTAATYGELLFAKMRVDDYTLWNGENPQQLDDRVKQFLSLLEASTWENVIVFSHGEFIMHLCSIALDTKLSKRNIYPPNGSIIALEYDGKHWHLLCWNCHPEY